MYSISRYLDPWPWPIFHAPVFYTFYVNVPLSLGCMIRKVSAEDIAIRGNGTGQEYMCPTRLFVYIFFNPVFQVSTAKNEINLFNNHVLIVAPVTFAPAGAMTPSAEFLLLHKNWKLLLHFPLYLLHYFVSPFHRCLVNAISMDYARSRAGQYTSRIGSKSVAPVRSYWKLRSHALTARELPC